MPPSVDVRIRALRRRLRPVRRAVVAARRELRGSAPSTPPPAKSHRPRAPIEAATPPGGDRPIAKDPTMPRHEVRRAAAFATADRAGRILEIGPAHNGTFPRRDGFRTTIVDYLDRDGLVEKYAEFPQYSPDDIEDVDYVLAPGAELASTIPERFDLVFASHVIEHTTSLVHFLRSCTELLAPGGTIALVIPDKRWCFDRFRERASLSRIIDAAERPPDVHTRGALAEFTLYTVRKGNSSAWNPDHRGKFAPTHDLAAVRSVLHRAEDGAYIDMHNWVFTPNHFRLLLHDLHALGYLTVRESFFRNTVGHEFFLNLTVDGPGPDLDRRALLRLSDLEHAPVERVRFEGEPGSPSQAP